MLILDLIEWLANWTLKLLRNKNNDVTILIFYNTFLNWLLCIQITFLVNLAFFFPKIALVHSTIIS